MYDLHLHSSYSDGDLRPDKLMAAAANAGSSGVSLTDHNGVWGLNRAASAARRLGIAFIEGIEISISWQGKDVHVLGYSHKLNRPVLREGLASTRDGYQERAREMVRLCRELEYDRVTFDALVLRRAGQTEPVYASYDVARELTLQYGLTVEQARKLTVGGGLCHVPYGSWALTAREALRLLKEAGALTVLAHPGLVVSDFDEKVFSELLGELVADGLDGLEVNYPYHDTAMLKKLGKLARDHKLIITGGSDWHGPGRYAASDKALGKVGMDENDWQIFLARLDAR